MKKYGSQKKYPNSSHCNNLRNSHDEFFVIDERGVIQTYSHRSPSGEHNLVMQTTDQVYFDYWRQVLPSFYKAPPFSKVKGLLSYEMLAKTNWIVVPNLSEMRFSDEVFRTMDDEKTFYTKADAFKIEFQLQMSIDQWSENLQLIMEEDYTENTKILYVDFILEDFTPSANEVGHIPSTEDFYYKQLSQKIQFDGKKKILIRFKKRNFKEFYDDEQIFWPCALVDEYEVNRIPNEGKN